jgi:hypothetical protein
MTPKLVVIESPYSGEIENNIEYLLECMHDSYYTRREAPYASHLLYTRLPKSEYHNQTAVHGGHVADASTSRHGRDHGIACGLVWGQHADIIAVYTDRGITEGMIAGIRAAESRGAAIEYRTLEKYNN